MNYDDDALYYDMIATELFYKLNTREKWGPNEKRFSKKVSRVMDSKLGATNQYIAAKRICAKKFKECQDNDTLLYQFEDWLDKEIRMTQRRLNGNTLKHKKEMQKAHDMYVEYKRKVNALLNE